MTPSTKVGIAWIILGLILLAVLPWWAAVGIIIIAAAWAFGRLGKKFGHALPVGEIAAGILLGPSALGLIWPADWK